jgi:hypothetical protein
MISLLSFYFACQIFLIVLFVYLYTQSCVELEKEDVAIMLLFLVFSPIGTLIFFGVILIENLQAKRRRACNRIVSKWENAARVGLDYDDTWDWYTDPSKAELRQNRLRETIGCLTDHELDMLITVHKTAYELEKFIRDAVIDEIIHREIRKA